MATPHLGASTDEAQEKAGIAVARSVRLALSGELVPDAVNVQGGVIAEDVRPGIPLTEKLGRVFTALAGEVAQQLDLTEPARGNATHGLLRNTAYTLVSAGAVAIAHRNHAELALELDEALQDQSDL